jgi:galactokinase
METRRAPSESVTNADLTERFTRKFAAAPKIVQAPGRVNLIGEHTDYNDGFVMPAAIQFHTSVAIAPRSDRRLALHSENYHETVEFNVDDLPAKARHHWSDYVIGVARQIAQSGVSLPAANLMIHGDVPQGAGLSSSASLEVAVCTAFLEIAGSEMKSIEVAQLCQRAENEFVGARCGIMDQFVSVHGKNQHALQLDCRTLQFQLRPLPDDIKLVICNTMVRHTLAGGEYNQRRQECEEAVGFFAGKKAGVKALRDVSLHDFREHELELPEPIRRRCRHVITENIRVLEAGAALERHDLERFGELMRESHRSLRDDFQVSCAELDLMVELADKAPGVYGSRMTGGGFGGCTVNLVAKDHVAEFRATVAEGYERAIGKRPEIYICTASDGVKRAA